MPDSRKAFFVLNPKSSIFPIVYLTFNIPVLLKLEAKDWRAGSGRRDDLVDAQGTVPSAHILALLQG